jgi:peroxiredoxin
MQRLVIVLVAAVALMSGLFLSVRHYAQPEFAPQQQANVSLIGKQRPDFRLGSNTGKFVTPADFPGKTLLFNFWATWCTPCRHEMPMLVDLQNEFGTAGLQVVGIALDDVQAVREFVQTYGISYPILVGAGDVMLTSAAYGNTAGVLPYSVLVDSNGIVRWQYTGEIRREEFLSILGDLL